MALGGPVGHEFGKGVASGRGETLDVELSLVGEAEPGDFRHGVFDVPVRCDEAPLDQGVDEGLEGGWWDAQVQSEISQVVGRTIVEAKQHPAAARVEVEPGPVGEALVGAYPPFPAHQDAEGPSDLVEGGAHRGHGIGGQGVGRVGCLGRLAERNFFEQPGQCEGDRGDGDGDEEHGVQGCREGVDVARVHGGRQLGERGRAGPSRAVETGGDRGTGEVVGQVAGELVGEDGAEHRGSERPSDRAEEGGARGGDTEVLVGDGILHGDDQDLHDATYAHAEHEHVQRAVQGAGVDRKAREQVHPYGHEGRAEDGEDLVAAPAGDQQPRGDRGEKQTGHEG